MGRGNGQAGETSTSAPDLQDQDTQTTRGRHASAQRQTCEMQKNQGHLVSCRYHVRRNYECPVPVACQVGSVLIPSLQMEKLRFREAGPL